MAQVQLYDMSGRPALSTSTDEASFDSRLSRIEDIVPYRLRGGVFAGQGRNQFLPLSSDGVTGGKISLSAGQFQFQGIMSPNVVDGAFTVGSPSTTTATVYWDGTNSSRVIIIRRPDGTTTTVTPSTLSLTNLTAAAAYQAYAYWVPYNGCGLGFAPGDTGTPMIAFSAAATATTLAQAQAIQSLVGREPIGHFSWTQPAAGSTAPGPPATPPARDPGTCVMVNTNVEPVGDIAPDEWRILHHHQQEWVRLETTTGRVLHCTPNHPLYDPEAQRRADWFKYGSWVVTDQGEEKISDVQHFLRDCTKMQVQMKRGHLFWANGFLSHNYKLPQD